MPRPSPSDDTLYFVMRAIKDGETLEGVAKKIGFSPDCLSQNLRRRIGFHPNSVYRPSQNAKPIDKIALINAFLEGRSVKALAAEFGVQRKTVADHIKRLGYNLRSGSEANRIRMQKLSSQERTKLASNAHKAIRGKVRSDDERQKVAASRELAKTHCGPFEDALCNAMIEAGHRVEPQKALGRYNLDFLVCGCLAVEVSTRQFNAFRIERRKKLEEVRNAGLSLLYVEYQELAATERCLYKIIADVNEMCRNPAAFREDRVVRCRIERWTRVRDDLGRFSVVPSAEKTLYTRLDANGHITR